MTNISSVYYNKETKKEILFNEHVDKIIILNDFTLNDLFVIKNEILEYLYEKEVKNISNKNYKTHIEYIASLNMNDLCDLYFSDSQSVTFNILQMFLFKLHEKGFILLPFSIFNLKKEYFNLSKYGILDFIFNNNSELSKFALYLDDYSKSIKHKSYGNMYIKFFQRIYFSSNITSLSDFHPDIYKLFLDIEKIFTKSENESSYKSFKTFAPIFINYYIRIENKYNWKDLFIEQKKKKYIFFNDLYEKHFVSEEWIILANEYMTIMSASLKQLDRVQRGLNLFFEYLNENKLQFSSPMDIKREIHIKDISGLNKNTYFEKVNNTTVRSISKNSFLFSLQEFFEFLKAEHFSEMKVPINKYDRVPVTEGKNSITSRKRVHSSIINIGKEILLRNDFEFTKNYIRNETQLKIFDDKGEMTYWMGYTVAMYILLSYPIRNKQARWLDSGELDEYIIDFEKMEYIKNTNPYAIKGRKNGCLQIEEDYFSGNKFYVFFINTNKTGNQYKIPYVGEEILFLIRDLIIWNREYNSVITKPIKATEKNKEVRDLSMIIEDSVPLFLYPTIMNRNDMSVISDRLLHKFYYFLMKEIEAEILIKENKEIKLVKGISLGGTYQTVFDIHSLRVSGITNLIEAGVPIDIVSQFVAGHASTIMTLYYNKKSIEEISTVIEDLHNKSTSNLKHDLELMENIEDFEKNLFSTSQEFNTSSFQIMQDNKGYWNVGLSGICTVKCDEMGRPDKCCAKCQYWITGAPFIIGQVTEVNDLMYRIRAKAKKVKKLNMKYLEDFSDQVLGQIELLKEEVSTMISEWSLRYKYVNKSLELLNSSGENLPALITSEKVKLSIDKMDDFGIAFNICKYNELISEFDNTEAQFELEYFINKILINNSIEPFLFRLEREDSLKASNMFAKHILENYSYYHIEELIDGSMKLEGHDIKEIKFLIDNKLIEYKGV